jgi:geranylgeranyl reductase family protein
MRSFDAAVIGAGPAGSVCAWELARSGVDTVLVDRSRFPRDKTCGGAVGGGAATLLTACGILDSSALDDLVIRDHYSMQCFWRLEPLRIYTSAGPPIRLVDRGAFDAALLERARDAGVEVVEGDPFAVLERGSIRLRSGSRLGFRKIVGADGAHSAVARSALGCGPARRGFGLEFFLPARGGLDDRLQIHFGLEPYGYGWVFPRGEDVCVGLGRCDRYARPSKLLESLLRFIDMLGFPKPDLAGLKAASLPAGRPSDSLGSGDVYLAGDAAGLVDRVSGEGIALAVESGLLVAGAISRGWPRERLREAASAGCTGRVRDSALARHLLYMPVLRRMAMRRLSAKDKFYEGFWKLVSGETGYRGMLRGFLRTP